MSTHRVLALAVALPLASVLWGCERDRDPAPADHADIDVAATLAELQEVYAALRPIQERAFASPDVLAGQRRLQERVAAAILDEHPEMEAEVAEARRLSQAAMEALERGDTARAGELNAAAHAAQRRLVEAETRAMRRPEVREEMARFERSVRDRMAALDPEAERLVARARELEADLEAAFPGPEDDPRRDD